MGSIINFLMNYGYWGMLVAAFLAGSLVPFSSEAVMVGLMAAGLKPWTLVIYGTLGNVAGSFFDFFIGRLGKIEWVEKYLHIKKEKLYKAQHFMAGHGAWMGFFSFLPFLGRPITFMLGYMRANTPIALCSITIGKLIRYILIIYGISLFL